MKATKQLPEAVNLPEQFLGRQAELVLFPLAVTLGFENRQSYRLHLGRTEIVALSYR